MSEADADLRPSSPPPESDPSNGRSTTWRERLEAAVLAPVRALRLAYLPLLMVYFAYGALGLIAISDSFWVKRELSLTPADLSALAVWLALPWAIKMVFGELVDTVAVLGSRRRVYVFLGAGLVATSLVMLAGASGRWITFASKDTIYVSAQLLSVVGVVLQDVVADAMSTEVVPRHEADGTPRPKEAIDHDLGMVQVLGRLSLSLGIFLVAGLGGVLASTFSASTVYLIGLVVPAISISGAVLVDLKTAEQRPTDWRILGGGLAFGAFAAALALRGVPYNQEIVFVVSLVVVVTMLVRVTREIDRETRLRIFYASLIIFAFRATPGVGEGYRWFAIDRLGFDEAFFGVLAQTGAAIGLVATWLLAEYITRKPVTQVLLWITILGTLLALPNIALVYELHTVTEAKFGIGARTIAIVDTAAQSPFAQLSMIPLLTLVAIYAPPGHRATWFALMASLMNLALVAGELQTKLLNTVFAVDRGAYQHLPTLVVTATAIGFLVPIAVITALGRRVR